jgi:hypothetical protein
MEDNSVPHGERRALIALGYKNTGRSVSIGISTKSKYGCVLFKLKYSDIFIIPSKFHGAYQITIVTLHTGALGVAYSFGSQSHSVMSALGRKLTLIQTIRQFPICLQFAQSRLNHNKSLRSLS